MYANILMLYCRRTMRYSPQKAASLLKMTHAEYKELECGNVLPNDAQLRRLGNLYRSEARYFREAAQQLDQLLSSRVVIQILKADNDRLQASLENLKGLSSL